MVRHRRQSESIKAVVAAINRAYHKATVVSKPDHSLRSAGCIASPARVGRVWKLARFSCANRMQLLF